jgi:hypothetical protein
MHRSIKDVVSVASSVLPVVGNNDTEGTGVGVPLAGYGSALAIVSFGQSGDTLSGSVKLQAILQHSDALASGYVDVPADELDGAFTLIDDPAEDETVQVVGYKGSKGYLRVFVDFTGTHTNGIPISAVVVRGHPTYAPTT